MASNNDGPRRDPDRPEDNPFIAFRHFTDKHVSSLLGMMFTLPATLSNPTQRQTAIGKCIVSGAGLGTVDPERCKELFEMERRISETLSEAQQLSRRGQAKALEEKHNEIVKTISKAEMISRQILEETGISTPSVNDDRKKQSELVEKVANTKGQEWASSWGWGFPAPFDATENRDGVDSWAKRREDRWEERREERREERKARWRRNRRSSEEHDENAPDDKLLEGIFSRKSQKSDNRARHQRAESSEEDDARYSRVSQANSEAMSAENPLRESHARQEYQMQIMLQAQQNRKRLLLAQQEQEQAQLEQKSPTQPENDQQPERLENATDGKQRTASPTVAQVLGHRGDTFWHCRTVYAPDPDGTVYNNGRRAPCFSPYNPFERRAYSVRALEESEEMKKAGVSWRDAFEDLYAFEHGAPLMPKERIGQSSSMSYHDWLQRFRQELLVSRPSNLAMPKQNPIRIRIRKSVPWEGEETNQEPSYEYAHDHEDQHDDPPEPEPKTKQGWFTKGMPATELDAYERLLSQSSAPAEPTSESRPSPLATFTTTERTIAPDGTITTKVVLRKRFADGHEESSESVRTQLAKENEQQQQPTRSEQGSGKTGGGWFWSK